MDEIPHSTSTAASPFALSCSGFIMSAWPKTTSFASDLMSVATTHRHGAHEIYSTTANLGTGELACHFSITHTRVTSPPNVALSSSPTLQYNTDMLRASPAYGRAPDRVL